MTKSKLTGAEAKERFIALCIKIDGKRPSSFTTKERPNSEALAADNGTASATTIRELGGRTIAYLTGYVDLGGTSFPVTGIELQDCYLWPDKAVINFLANSGFLLKKDGFYHLTSSGRDLIKQYLPQLVASTWPEPLPGKEADGLPRGRTGEGPNHKALRVWIKDHPEAIIPGQRVRIAATEVELLSGDRVDVVFETDDAVYAIEVKSRDSDEGDHQRGVYQCIKYRAVLRAMPAHENMPIKAILVTENALEPQLANLAKAQNIAHMMPPPNWKS